MDSLDSLWARYDLENFFGSNTECLQCREVFFAHEDGCPHCGAGARTRSTVEGINYDDCKPDRSPNGYRFFLYENGTSQIVSNKNFSPWPREMEVEDGVFFQAFFNKETGEFHLLDGSFSPWPREE